jgi:hypothetical protein
MPARTPKSKKSAVGARRTTPAPPISEATILEVYVAAAGRCSFYGHNETVMREPLTNKKARLGNIAHIVADKKDGPRGNDPLQMAKRSEADNLMLMCTLHHNFIDKRENVPDYPVSRLRHFKQMHEARMRRITVLPDTAKTHAIRFFGQIRGNLVTVSDTEVFDAIFAHEKRYTAGDVFDIDLGNLPDTADDAYWTTGRRKIDAALQQRILPLIENGTVERLSILAPARIPLLAYFGHQLGDKVPTELYQKHRTDGEGWAWPASGHEVTFEIVPHGDVSSAEVALLVSVSGGDIGKARRATKAGLIYEIRPVGETPSRTLLDSPATLRNFRNTYQSFLSLFEAQHASVKVIDCFLAVPAPIAILCGRDLQNDVPPTLALYELVEGEYHRAFTLN